MIAGSPASGKSTLVLACLQEGMGFHTDNRQGTFKAEPLPPAQAVALLMQEYITQQQAKDGEAETN